MKVISNHYVFEYNDPEYLKTFIPDVREAVIQGKSYVAVPHKLEAAQVLNNLGIPALSPIEYAYSWPGAFKPYEHQKKTAGFATLNKRCYINNGLGSGKSVSVLWAADFLMKHGYIKKCLIVSPLSTLDVVWGKELFVHFPHRSYTVLHGAKQKRRELLAQDKDFYIINHHGIALLEDDLLKRTDIDLIIVDELSCFRSHKTTTLWKPLKKLVSRNIWVWGMTGSPTPNAPTDAFAQIKLITPEKYNGSFTRFKMDTMFQVSAFRYLPRNNAATIVHSLMQPAIRYALRECVDLPETIYSSRHAELSPEQAKRFGELQKEAVTTINGNAVTAVNAAVLINKLVQISTGCVYSADGEVNEIDCSPRLAVLKECIDECDEKVIVFVSLTGALHSLYNKLKKDYSCAVLDGSTSMGKRTEIFNAFQRDENPRVLLANAGAMSHGITLTAASTIIWFAPDYNNDTYCQANGRIVRPGQKNITNIIHISSTPVEDRVYEALRLKNKLQDAVLSLFKNA